MRAMVQAEYGQPGEVLRPGDVERPVVGEGQVLLRVRAAGVDRGAWHLTTGLPYPVRLAGYGVRRPKTAVRGREVAGVVEEVGPGVAGFATGDEVFGIAEGCFAEYVVADAAKLAHRPDALTPEQAAALPISGLTALQAVRDAGRVAAGDRVLVLGASGGVGHLAVQLAKARGAHVTGVASAAKADLVRRIGADVVVDYATTDVAALVASDADRFDVVIDTGGNRTLTALRRVLAEQGRLVLVGGETGGRWLGGFDRQLRAPLAGRLTGRTMIGLMASEDGEDLTELADLAASGAVVPVVQAYPLERAAQALGDLAGGRVAGKAVVVA